MQLVNVILSAALYLTLCHLTSVPFDKGSW